MSDPEVPQPEQSHDVDDVLDSAKAGLADAAAAGADVPASADGGADVDPDLAAFEAAEQNYPGTFGLPEGTPAAPDGLSGDDVAAAPSAAADTAGDDAADAAAEPEQAAEPAEAAPEAAEQTAAEPAAHTVADTAYAAPAYPETAVMPSEPTAPEPAAQPFAAAAPAAAPLPQPIFVQAPEPPRDRGNRGTAGAIGLLAALVFAVLFLGAQLAIGAVNGEVTGENIVDALIAPLTTWSFWVPVAAFFLGYWFLGALVNRARWGKWVVLGLFVGLITWAGAILGVLFEAPFWSIAPSQALEIAGAALFSPSAVIAFIIARELTIWFGAWVARSGARKNELNAEAQREYERTLEAGPTLSR